MTITCSATTWHLFDTIIVVSSDKELIVVLIHQSLSDGKCQELLRAIFSRITRPFSVFSTTEYNLFSAASYKQQDAISRCPRSIPC